MNAATDAGELSILRAFGDDHQRLRRTLADAIEACGHSSARDARALFSSFADELRRHIVVEEVVLFPIFEVHTSMRDHGPTAVMRAEHRKIERHLDSIAAALAQDADLALLGQLAALQALLADHDRREESAIYPACDRFFRPGERTACVRALPTNSLTPKEIA